MKTLLIIIFFITSAFLCTAETVTCKDFFFTFTLPTTIKITTTNFYNIYNLSYDFKYTYSIDTVKANLAIIAKNDPNINEEYSASELLTQNDSRYVNNTLCSILYNDKKDWAYIKTTINKITKGYFSVSNGPDIITVILDAPETEYNNYEETIIKFVKSIDFTGKRPFKSIQSNAAVNNSPVKTDNTPNTTTNPVVPQTQVTPPTQKDNNFQDVYLQKKYINMEMPLSDDLLKKVAGDSSFSFRGRSVSVASKMYDENWSFGSGWGTFDIRGWDAFMGAVGFDDDHQDEKGTITILVDGEQKDIINIQGGVIPNVLGAILKGKQTMTIKTNNSNIRFIIPNFMKNDDPNRYACPICGEKQPFIPVLNYKSEIYENQKLLDAHFIAMHGAKCQLCNARFFFKSDLENHIKTAH